MKAFDVLDGHDKKPSPPTEEAGSEKWVMLIGFKMVSNIRVGFFLGTLLHPHDLFAMFGCTLPDNRVLF